MNKNQIANILLIIMISLSILSPNTRALFGAAPEFSDPNPVNETSDISVMLSQVSIYIEDMDDDGFENELAWSIEVSNGDSDSGSGEASGTKTCSLTTPLEYGTEYTWWVNATTDSQGQAKGPTNGTYSFTTTSNTAPIINSVKMWNSTTAEEKTLNSTSVTILTTSINVSVEDPEGDNMNVTIRTNASGTWKDVNVSGTVTNGTIVFTNTSWISAWDTDYWLSVNSSDDTLWTNFTYSFYTNTIPSLSNLNYEPVSASAGTTFSFNVTITDLDNDTQTTYGVIKKSGGAEHSNNSMSYLSGFNKTGAIYNFTKIINVVGTYVCQFKTYDGDVWSTSTSGEFNVIADAEFQVSFPPFLEVGQYVIAEGTLIASTGDPLNNTWVYTEIQNSTYELVDGSNLSRWVNEGYYSYTFSTSMMTPGIYHILVNFTSGGNNHESNSTLYLSDSTGSGHYKAKAYFYFYNYNTGIGLDYNSFKIYADDTPVLTADDRLYANIYRNTYTGDTLYYRVDDYYDNQVYPNTGSYETANVDNVETFVDVPVDWNSFSVKNMNESIVYFKLTNGTTSYTQYLYPNEPFYWNVLDGNYVINLTYYDPDTDSILGYSEQNLPITEDAYYWIKGYQLKDVFIQGAELVNRSTVVFNFYNTNEGLGLDQETLKLYINGTRLTENVYHNDISREKINVTVKDYYNSTLFHRNFTISSGFQFIDLGLTFHSWLFGNQNDDYYMISILKQGANRWWERGIVPNGEREFLIPSGTYAFRVYDKAYNELYNSSLPASVLVVNSKVYVIRGTNLSEIISGQSVIRGQLLEILDDISPSIVKVGYNIPFIRLCYDRVSPINNLLGANITLVCPPQIMEGTTYNHTYTNRTIHPCIPGNTSTNGTITVPDLDRLWFHHKNGTWVNISYENGTLIKNYTYTPTFVDLNGAPTIWLNSSHNMSVTRETRYHQVQEFDYTLYTDLNKYQATVNFTNPLNKVVEEVSFYIAFADDGNTPDYGGVEVYDVTNSMTLTEGEHYDSSAKGIEMGVGSLYSGESRKFRVTYYVEEENIQPKEAIVVIDDFGQMKKHEGENYYVLNAQWINRESETFIGPIYIQFNFTMPNIVSRESLDVWDDHNRQYLDRDEYAFTESGVIITQDVVGRVSPQGARTYDIYYLYTSETMLENVVFSFLDAPVIANVPGIGDLLGIHIVTIILLLIGITAILSGKNYRDHLWVFASCMLFIFLCTMAWLSPA